MRKIQLSAPVPGKNHLAEYALFHLAYKSIFFKREVRLHVYYINKICSYLIYKTLNTNQRKISL